MREKQCKYVNVFVYSFYLFFFFFSSLLFFFLPCLLMRRLWFITCDPSSLGQGPFWAICWSRSPAQCYPGSTGDARSNL